MKKAIVIGATSGIGQAIAKRLVSHGYKVGVMGRRTELLEELKSHDPDSYFTKGIDVTNTESIDKKLNEMAVDLGGLNLLILSSGIGDINEHLDYEIEQKTLYTNVIGFTCIADWTFKYFEKQGFGHFVGISSIGGLRGSRKAPSYNASKAFQANYLEGLRQKATNLQKPIYITDIRPGLVDTEMAKGEGLFWVMPVEKVTNQIYTAIKKKRKITYVTKRWFFIAMILKSIPKIIYDRM